MKTLAAQTGDATGQISSQIGAVQTGTVDTVDIIRSIGGVIGQVSEITTTIAAAVEQQGSATGEIARSVQHASSGVGAVSGSIAEVKTTSRDAQAAAGKVQSLADGLSAQMEKLNEALASTVLQLRAA